jgi:hypothetical protein
MATELATTDITEMIQKGGSLVQVLGSIRPMQKVDGKRSVHIAKKIVLNDRVKRAVDGFPALIENAISPTERRVLTEEEVTSLLEERQNLDLIEKVIKDRKEAHKTIVFNHFDADLEAKGEADGLDVDEHGYYIAKCSVGSPSHEKGFVRTVTNGSPSLSTSKLQEQVGQGDFTHEDFLACTTATRAIDEAKILLHLRKKPSIVSAIGAATTPGRQGTSHTLGKVES